MLRHELRSAWSGRSAGVPEVDWFSRVGLVSTMNLMKHNCNEFVKYRPETLELLQRTAR